MSPPMIRDPTSGYWGYPTSTMDWCEENYAVTPYIAEFWNTISNFVFVVPPMIMAFHFWKYKLSELGHIVCFLLLTLVGIGSFAFHCTLLYESQLLDELPMIYGTCAMLYCIMEVRAETGKCNTRLVALLSTIASLVTVVYAMFKNPLIFLWSYGILAAALFVLNIKECINGYGSSRLLILGSMSYGFGFILWNIDNELCYSVRAVREKTPNVIVPVTQLHAWWHLLAGVGTFLTIIYSLNIRIKCLGYEPVLKVIYWCIPYYEKGQRTVGEHVVNGKLPSEKPPFFHPSIKMKNSDRIIGIISRLM